jgi:two-component system OmpR family response regulator
MDNLKVLFVDDEKLFLTSMAMSLEQRQYRCATAQNGERALQLLRSEHFDCAIVDVRMPGMDGIELLRTMRKEFPGIPVILLSGYASVDLGVQGMELGAFDYLMKPLDLDELLDTIRRAVQDMTLLSGKTDA